MSSKREFTGPRSRGDLISGDADRACRLAGNNYSPRGPDPMEGLSGGPNGPWTNGASNGASARTSVHPDNDGSCRSTR
ncbi:hypothetical protein ACFU6I_39005 [Streptomyces sp. NPDC057486]|uniref:hypothetical protein n=1 Tax=Streptomyces sp. NPDC057486 TaxID=3346145 RepID=UPI003696593F